MQEPYDYSGKDYLRPDVTGSYGMNCRDSLNPKASGLRRNLHRMQHSSHQILDMLSMRKKDQMEGQEDQKMDHSPKRTARHSSDKRVIQLLMTM